ncbi:TetR/AcrR family transcriptional regulator [Corynebacterium marinum]|jgi:AcrR family transcriptional regulator|uniref:Transcriptional regulator, TetR-family n=2 Tax=Corynebacterium marinum TaxID=349751 RepID=A0A0B6TJ78_9CORY|nr:TetR/AcrR family transcriptional regulator [Corynebacterium marinum]AJK67983.1 transcriptional regulator, TetR-family [Corynebacterium marinum DSM 44953]NLF91701.1 TetR/AcrR family transcriptional regulator [Corynebacterium marinum]GGO11383.1 TetR family transcriptional regulator [Corynebacterium marinum]
MPKISEATVARHRAAQQRAVLDAARKLIVDGGGKVPTLAEVAADVGLARSSVYLYVSSREDMVVQLLRETIPAWLDELAGQIGRAGTDPADRLAVYVRVTLDLFVEGSHGPLMTAAQAFPGAFADERVQQEHNGLEPALHTLLGDAASLSRPLLDAAIQRGAELVAQSGADVEAVAAVLQRMARASLAGDLEESPVGD